MLHFEEPGGGGGGGGGNTNNEKNDTAILHAKTSNKLLDTFLRDMHVSRL